MTIDTVKIPDPKEIVQLKIYNKAYREGNPAIADNVYDVLYREAQQKYPNNDFFLKAMPEEIKNAVKLPFVMGSLDNKDIHDVGKWAEQWPCESFYIATYKLDGVSMTLQYRDGKLTLGASRGKGEVGQNMTDKASFFVPKTIKTKEAVTVRGEVLLAVDPSTIGYMNRRNAVAGILNRDDTDRLKYLRFIVFELLECDDIPNRESDRLDRAGEFGFDVVPKLLITKELSDKMPNILEQIVKKFQADPKREYDIDGAVVCPDTYKYENVHYPKAKIAFKKQAEIHSSEVTKVLWDVSRLGRVIPVVCFNSLLIDGANISKATGFHASFIAKNAIKKGKTVRVIRSKEVIPMVLEEASKQPDTPDYSLIPRLCPVCKSDLEWDDNAVHLLCGNTSCSSQVYKKITHFFVSLGLKDFTEKSFRSLKIDSLAKAFNMTEEDIKGVEGWGESSAKSFVEGVQAIRATTVEKFLLALGIETLGRTFSKTIAALIKDDDGSINIDKFRYLSVNSLCALEGIGEKKATHIIMSLKKQHSFIKEAVGLLTFRKTEVGKLSGKLFCITGKLSKARKEIENDIEKAGGSIGSIKSGPTNFEQYLLCNAPSTSSKYLKAQKLKIPIITEDQLAEMLK